MPIIAPPTDEERRSWPPTIKVDLEAPFVDERGAIQPLVDVKMQSCVLISSKQGTVRANHYHKTDWHYCYVVSGSIDYYERPHGTDDTLVKATLTPGDMFFTGPMVDHVMVFPEDTVFLTFGRNSRSQEVYEADVERIDPIQPGAGD